MESVSESWLPAPTFVVQFADSHSHLLGFLSALLIHPGSSFLQIPLHRHHLFSGHLLSSAKLTARVAIINIRTYRYHYRKYVNTDLIISVNLPNIASSPVLTFPELFWFHTEDGNS